MDGVSGTCYAHKVSPRPGRGPPGQSRGGLVIVRPIEGWRWAERTGEGEKDLDGDRCIKGEREMDGLRWD